MHEEKLFVVCDIVEFVKQNLDKVRDFVVDDMTDENGKVMTVVLRCS